MHPQYKIIKRVEKGNAISGSTSGSTVLMQYQISNKIKSILSKYTFLCSHSHESFLITWSWYYALGWI